MSLRGSCGLRSSCRAAGDDLADCVEHRCYLGMWLPSCVQYELANGGLPLQLILQSMRSRVLGLPSLLEFTVELGCHDSRLFCGPPSPTDASACSCRTAQAAGDGAGFVIDNRCKAPNVRRDARRHRTCSGWVHQSVFVGFGGRAHGWQLPEAAAPRNRAFGFDVFQLMLGPDSQ